MNIICTYLLAYYTAKLNGSLMSVRKKMTKVISIMQICNIILFPS